MIAVDLRGDGNSPRATHSLGLEDLPGALHESIAALLDPEEKVDVLLGHSLGALAALEFCREHVSIVEKLLVEDPPGFESIDFDGISRGVEANVARAKEAPKANKREQLEENPSWSEGDSLANVESLRDYDAEPVAAMVRNGLHYGLATLVGSVEVPALLVMGSETRGSTFPKPEGTTVADALHRGTVETSNAGHGVHRDDFEGYVRLLSNWLDRTEVREKGISSPDLCCNAEGHTFHVQ